MERFKKRILSNFLGEVAEWLKAAVLKTVMGREAHPEFESLPLRLSLKPGEYYLYCLLSAFESYGSPFLRLFLWV